MKFGIFDHMDRASGDLGRQFDQRLKLIELYEKSGFYAYHIAEHHATPLGMAPSPSVFLAAVAQRTKRLRFGPLVYTVNLYHPLRLIDEICMLDQMSGGRLELGVGRGISPYEVGYYGVDPATGPERFAEALDIARRAYRRWRASFWYLWIKYDAKPRFAPYPEEFDDLVLSGQGIAGSAQTVRAALAAQIAETGVNYLLLDLAFGDLSLAESLRSVELFARDVMPGL